MPRLVLLTLPVVEPVSTAELKTYLRIDVADEDSLLASLIVAARQAVENYTGRALITQSWRLSLDSWPTTRASSMTGVSGEGGTSVIRHPASRVQLLNLPRAPLQTVNYVRVIDGTGAWKTVDALSYRVDTAGSTGRLMASMGGWLPDPYELRSGIQVDFTAGYGATASSVPEVFKQAIRTLAGLWFAGREQQGGSVLPSAVTGLLAPYRLYPY